MDTILMLLVLSTTAIVLAIVFRLAYAYIGFTPCTIITGLGSLFMFGSGLAKLFGFLEWSGLITCCVIYCVLVLPGVLGSILSTRVLVWYVFGSGNTEPIRDSLLDHGEYDDADARERSLPAYMQEP